MKVFSYTLWYKKSIEVLLFIYSGGARQGGGFIDNNVQFSPIRMAGWRFNFNVLFIKCLSD